MSILIKGMEMPTSCWDCEVGGAKQMDNATCSFYSMEFWEQENYRDKIADGCHLFPVPPHGDLIDKSDLMKLFQDEERYGYIDALDIVALPTIIPAELPVHHGTFAAASEKRDEKAFNRGGRDIKIEITYNNGEKFTAYLAEETYENVMACLVDDVSVSVLHNMGKAEEGER